MNRHCPRCINCIRQPILEREVSRMLGFVIGCMVGGTVGLVTACCCVAAGNADRHMDQ